MRLSTLASAALLSLASAENLDTLYSDSNIISCQGTEPNQVNATSFTAALTPVNNTLSFAFSGTSQVKGNDTIGLRLFANGNQVYQTLIDPCRLQLPSLCPIDTGRFDLPKSNVAVPEGALGAFNQAVETAALQFRLNISTISGGWRTSCVQVGLHNKTEAAQNGTTASGRNGTSGNNSTNGTNPPGSGASFLQLNWIFVVLALGVGFL